MIHGRRFASASLGVVALVLTSALPSAAAPTISVDIVDAPRPQPRWGYAPGTRTIATGTWVTWSNTGQDMHTVTATDGSFDSGNLQPSEGFSWFFADPGTYNYLCALHPWMVGKVIVGDGQATPPPPAPEPQTPDSPLG